MAVNKIEIALKEALKKAMVKCNFVEDYEINQITIEIPKEKVMVIIQQISLCNLQDYLERIQE